jgi:hypothetical protein
LSQAPGLWEVIANRNYVGPTGVPEARRRPLPEEKRMTEEKKKRW